MQVFVVVTVLLVQVLYRFYAFSWGVIFKKWGVVTAKLGTVGIMKNARWNKIILIFDPQRA